MAVKASGSLGGDIGVGEACDSSVRYPVALPSTKALRLHWPEYLIEGAGLGVFMLSACLITALLEHPSSPVNAALPNATFRRFLLGLGMGGTAVAIVYSPWGQRSGAHINPAVTLSFLRLGKIARWDAAFYITAQFLGSIAGVATSAALIPRLIADPSVNYGATVPGKDGPLVALVAELVISFVLMSVILAVGSSPRWSKVTGAATGVLVALFVFVAAPLSGFGMNPARSAGSAIVSGIWTAWWIYLFAPPFAMLLATEMHRRLFGARAMACAKLHHGGAVACIFCGADALQPVPTVPSDEGAR
jgi:aquaporin Z